MNLHCRGPSEQFEGSNNSISKVNKYATESHLTAIVHCNGSMPRASFSSHVSVVKTHGEGRGKAKGSETVCSTAQNAIHNAGGNANKREQRTSIFSPPREALL